MMPRLGMQGFHIVDELWPRRLRFVSGTRAGGDRARPCRVLDGLVGRMP
jgi:hypothetical protein